eukprot:TRINITY_DN23250_c0_g1_i1.p1 TRINITY_DN23250_c0_g1~~TRINITY_DN23250_c0_g1_i1.p1  ORF type:complete len:418 (-),score=72.00 TRINITY_DN23250_c0_g1_i1:44-1297(-)
MQWAALFKKDAVKFAADSLEWLRWYKTDTDTVYLDGAEKQLPCKIQCKHCGTWIADEGRNMIMAFPTLFEFVAGGGVAPQFPDAFLPKSHIFCATRALEMNDGLALFLDDNRTPESTADFLKFVAPALDGRGHKGSSGRIGVLGGSIDFAGAPYYAGISALRIGAELLYLCTAAEGAGPIKSYSPELMVSPVYSHARITDPSLTVAEQEAFVSQLSGFLPRFHALCIGPGLGRQPGVLASVARVIQEARGKNIPLVIDADGLWLINEQPALVQGYDNVILTPNGHEFKRLAEKVTGNQNADLVTVAEALQGPCILQKGAIDKIFAANCGLSAPLECREEGAPRRPGGIGDLLCGTLTTILAWTMMRRPSNRLQACLAACTVVRRACRIAYDKQKRSTVAPDIIGELGPVFESMCPAA